MATILIVDDDEVDREAARRALTGIEDLRVEYAGDGRAALERVERERPDLVLTDLRMPRMDGLALVEHLQQEHPELPVVLMTSQGSETIAVQALKAGAMHYVPKREVKHTLADTIRNVLVALESRRSRAELIRWMDRRETEFQLENDPGLVFPAAGFLQDGLAQLGFATPGARTQIGIALMEAISNGMIHGNLEIGSELRRSDREAYARLVDERRAREPYRSRRVTVRAVEKPGCVEYLIEDQGPGFDTRRLPDPTQPANLLETTGRGIFLMRTFMDRVEYAEGGNRLRLVKFPSPAAA